MWSESRWLDDLRQRMKNQGHPEDCLDDATWIAQPNGGWLVASTDMLVEGTHFNLWDGHNAWSTPQDIGWKAAAVSLSDMAACGATPLGLLLAIGVPSSGHSLAHPLSHPAVLQDVYEGVFACLETFHTPLLGGDTVAATQWTLTSTTLGAVSAVSPKAHRSMAQPGDVVALCGWHGLSAVGLQTIQSGTPGYSLAKKIHKRPTPLLKEAQELCEQTARLALMDTSDGIADAALKIANASKVFIELDFASIPLHPEIQAFAHTKRLPQEFIYHTVLYGGEDFGLLACVPPQTTLPKGWTVIGSVSQQCTESSAAVRYGDNTIEPLCGDKTFQHFGRESTKELS